MYNHARRRKKTTNVWAEVVTFQTHLRNLFVGDSGHLERPGVLTTERGKGYGSRNENVKSIRGDLKTQWSATKSQEGNRGAIRRTWMNKNQLLAFIASPQKMTEKENAFKKWLELFPARQPNWKLKHQCSTSNHKCSGRLWPHAVIVHTTNPTGSWRPKADCIHW